MKIASFLLYCENLALGAGFKVAYSDEFDAYSDEFDAYSDEFDITLLSIKILWFGKV